MDAQHALACPAPVSSGEFGPTRRTEPGNQFRAAQHLVERGGEGHGSPEGTSSAAFPSGRGSPDAADVRGDKGNFKDHGLDNHSAGFLKDDGRTTIRACTVGRSIDRNAVLDTGWDSSPWERHADLASDARLAAQHDEIVRLREQAAALGNVRRLPAARPGTAPYGSCS